MQQNDPQDKDFSMKYKEKKAQDFFFNTFKRRSSSLKRQNWMDKLVKQIVSLYSIHYDLLFFIDKV